MRRRPAVAAALLLCVLAACSSGGDDAADDAGEDPVAPAASEPEPAAAGSGYGRPVVRGNLADAEITESSGLVASRRNPGSYWTHNDSGGGPLVYCVEGHGESCGTWVVTDADALDWEDIAAGPGPHVGTPYLYLGDIGDNGAERDDIVVYRVPEPAAGDAPATQAAPVVTEPAEVLRLQYPDGPHDAEALLVHPETGDIYIVAKETDPGVYVARAPVAAGTTTLTKVANLAIDDAVTGGDISPDGRRVALSTYLDGLELRLPAGSARFDDVWRQPPRPVSLGLRAQGESVAYRLDGKALLATSERRGGLAAPLLEVPQTG